MVLARSPAPKACSDIADVSLRNSSRHKNNASHAATARAPERTRDGEQDHQDCGDPRQYLNRRFVQFDLFGLFVAVETVDADQLSNAIWLKCARPHRLAKKTCRNMAEEWVEVLVVRYSDLGHRQM